MIVINVPLSKGLIIHGHIYRSKVEEVFPNWYVADVASYLGKERVKRESNEEMISRQ